jgi:hypothetical protein
MSLNERRKKERKPYINSIEIYSQESKRSLGKGFIMNWSDEGFGIISSNRLEHGKKLVLFCDLPNGQNFDFIGEVVRIEDRIDSKAYGIKLMPGQGRLLDRFSQQVSIA